MTKRAFPLLLTLALFFAAIPLAAQGSPTAEHLFVLYPNPEIPLSIDPALDPLLRLVNRDNRLGSSFRPRVVKPRVAIKKYADADLRPEAASALEALFGAAKAEGLPLVAVSGYRSWSAQKGIFERSVERNGWEKADRMSAQPGASEHQLGLAADLSCKSLNDALSSAFARKKEGKWVAAHCAEFGFILRYRDEWTPITGYQGEPWHIRYVGREHAAFITQLNVPFETYHAYLRLVWQSRMEASLATAPP